MKWNILAANKEKIKFLSKKLRLNPIIAKILVNRNIDNIEKAHVFLYGDLTHLHSPNNFSDINKALSIIKNAINNKKKIIIYGDYDVDGITSITVLYHFFKLIGKRVDYYIPSREHGYGLSFESIKELFDKGYRLIITVDCGISNYNEVKFARSLGMEVIITDHHEASGNIPSANAILNPKLKNCKYPFKYLAGVGVAFKLYQKLLKEFNFSDDFLYQIMDIVALGTIADTVPLIDENRIIARFGLRKMIDSNNIGIKALFKISGLNKFSKLTTEHITYILAPRINACGRIDNATLAVRLLTTEDSEEAHFLASKLNKINKKRQKIENKILKEAEKIIHNNNLNKKKSIIIYSKDWPSGVIGIVSSKLKDKYNCPVVLISIENNLARGSIRSIKEFPLNDKLMRCKHILKKFGGHEMAAGFTLHTKNIKEFCQIFEKFSNEITCYGNSLQKIDIDCELEFKDINYSLVKTINQLRPFGIDNPKPLFITKDISFIKYRLIGQNKSHIKFMVKQGKKMFEGIAYNMRNNYNTIQSPAQLFDMVYSLEINNLSGINNIQIRLKDFIEKNEIMFGGNYEKMD